MNRECLKGTILNNRDAEVSCPEACESQLLDREIKAVICHTFPLNSCKSLANVVILTAVSLQSQLLSDEEHSHFLELRLRIAESRADHSFHCQTPNCRGWCIYEDDVNEFPCQLCGENNCILCRVGVFCVHK